MDEDLKKFKEGEETKDAAVEIVDESIDDSLVGTLYEKFVKSHCRKCKLRRAAIPGKPHCSKCKKPLTYSCEICNETYGNTTDLDEHLKNQHTSQNTANQETRPWPMSHDEFSHRNRMLTHQRTQVTQHALVDESGSVEQHCVEFSEKFKSPQKKEDEKVCDEEAIFKCDKCFFAANLMSELVQHFKKHTGLEEKCQNCDKIFRNPISLRRHSRVCGKEKRIECHHCGRKFYRKEQVLNHLNRAHFKGRLQPRICQYCDKALERYENMSKHLKGCKSSPLYDGSDTSVRTCKYCGLTLRPHERMKKHLRRCESVPANCRIECEIADQSDLDTAWKNLLKAYCERCKAKIPAKKGQRSCEKCVTRLKFTCERCPNISRKYAGHLRNHLLVRHVKNNEIYRCDDRQKTRHPFDPSSINEYKCSRCGKKCNNKSSLEKHRVSCLEDN